MSDTSDVLLVDPDTGERTVRTLEGAGYETSVAGRDAVAVSDLDPTTAGAYDSLVVEGDLTDRDGIALAARVRSNCDVSVVVYTSAGNEAVASRAVTAGVDEYVRKSRGPGALVDALDRVLEDDRAPADRSDRRLVDRLLEISPGGLVVVDGDGRFTYANERAEEVLGLARTEIESRTYDDPEWELTDLSGRPLSSEELPYRRVLDSGKPVRDARIAVTTADGERKSLSVNGAPLSDGVDDDCVVLSITDVTECVERERDLERYRTIVETVGDVIYALDEEGRIVLANRALGEYLGRSREELLGTDVETLLPPEAYERGQELLYSLLRSDETDHGRYEFAVEGADGDTRHFENNVGLLGDDEYRGSVGVLRDITQRKRRAQALQRQNESLNEFISIVSHDLRGPLNVIQGTVDAVGKTGDLERLERIEDRAERMEALIADLLELARQGRAVSELEAISLERVVVDAWRNVETGDADLAFDDDLGTIEADAGRLQQLLENLFQNAVEHGLESSDAESEPDARAPAGVAADSLEAATPGTGAEAEADGPDLTVTVERTNEGFVVTDDGPGIDPAIKDDLFERGVTTSDDGTGYGLDIVRRIAEAHDRSIDVDDARDGAAFVVRT